MKNEIRDPNSSSSQSHRSDFFQQFFFPIKRFRTASHLEINFSSALKSNKYRKGDRRN